MVQTLDCFLRSKTWTSDSKAERNKKKKKGRKKELKDKSLDLTIVEGKENVRESTFLCNERRFFHPFCPSKNSKSPKQYTETMTAKVGCYKRERLPVLLKGFSASVSLKFVINGEY